MNLPQALSYYWCRSRARLLFLPLLIGMLLSLSPRVTAADKLLVIGQTPSTRAKAYPNPRVFLLEMIDYYTRPDTSLVPVWDVTLVEWLEAPEALQDLSEYKAVIIWDAPNEVKDRRDKGGEGPPADPYHRSVVVFPKEAVNSLEKFVENGGVLLMAGGALNYGDGHDKKGRREDQASFGNSPGDMVNYLGVDGEPLEALLPVDVPEGITLTRFAGEGKAGDGESYWWTMQPTGREKELLEGLDIANWRVPGFHKVSARDAATVILQSPEGDPLLAAWDQGKGKVIAFTPSAKAGAALIGSYNAFRVPGAYYPLTFWSGEPVLLNRLLRWGLGKKPIATEEETDLRNRYEHRIASEPKLPRKLILEQYPYMPFFFDQHFFVSSMRRLAFNMLRQQRFNSVSMGFNRTDSEEDALFFEKYGQACSRNNVYGYFHPDPFRGPWRSGRPPEEWAAVVQPTGKFATYRRNLWPNALSPLTKSTAEADAKHFAEFIDPAWVGFAGAFHDDEYQHKTPFAPTQRGGPAMGGYSEQTQAYVKARLGYEPPMPPKIEYGMILKEDDPFLRFIEVARMPEMYVEYNKRIERQIRRIHPDWVLSSYPGAFAGELGDIVEEVYLDCWRSSPLQAFESLVCWPNRLGDMRGTEYPVWSLIGIFRIPEDKSSYPETLRLTAGVSLAATAKAMILWNGVNLFLDHFQHKGRVDLMTVAREIGEYLQKYGQMHLVLERERKPLWVLTQWRYCNTWNQISMLPPPEGVEKDPERYSWGTQLGEVVTPAVMRAGLDPNFVTETQLMSPKLMNQKAVLLPGLLYTREAVYDNLQKFIRQGGTVYMDESSRLDLPGAKRLPVDFSLWHYDVAGGKRRNRRPTDHYYREQMELRDSYVRQAIPELKKAIGSRIPTDAELDSPEGAFRVLVNGEARYLFVMNTNMDEPRTFRVTLTNPPASVIDLEKAAPVALEKDGFACALPAGGWRVYVLSGRAPKGMELHAEMRDDAVRVYGNVRAGEQVWSGAAPIRLRLHFADEDKAPIDVYASSNRGLVEKTIPLAEAITRPVRIEATNLLTGETLEEIK